MLRRGYLEPRKPRPMSDCHMSAEKWTTIKRFLGWLAVCGTLLGLILGVANGVRAVASNQYASLGLANAALYTFQSVLNGDLTVVLAVTATIGIIAILAGMMRSSVRTAGVAAGMVTAAYLCVRVGYGVNRWDFESQWVAPHPFLGLPLRAGFFERQVILANLGILALSVLAGYVVYRLVTALLSSPSARRFRLPAVPGLRPLLIVMICLIVGSNIYSHLHRLRNGRGKPNVILISLDTLRADHVGCYGHVRDCTPNLDRIAREGVLFENAYAQAASTLPSHKSILTSLYPPSLRSEGRPMLDLRRVTLSEILLNEGYCTAAFVHGGWMMPVFGFGQGFDIYMVPGRNVIPEEPTAEAITRHAISWIRGHRDRTFFVFLHYGDIHSDWGDLPYDAPEPYRSMYLGDCAMQLDDLTTRISGSTYLAEVNRGRFCPTDEELEALSALYDSGIKYTDDQLGRLVSFLEELDLADDTMLILLADHGERLGEQGKMLHGWVTREVARVPLVIRFPGSVLAGRRVRGQVELVDVVPTVLDFIGVPPRREMCGTSLLTVAREGGDTGAAFTEAGTRCSVRSGGWMLAHDAETGEMQVYDLEADPHETTNLAGQFPDRERALAAELVEWLELAQAARLEGGEGDEAEVDESLKRLLESLGYLHVGR